MIAKHPHPPRIFDHAFTLVLAVAFPLFAKFYFFPKLLAGTSSGDPNSRLSMYLLTIVVQWSLVGALALAWRRFGRTPPMLGLSWPSGWRLIVTVALPLIAVVLLTLQNVAIATRPDVLEKVRAEMSEVSALVPHTVPELGLFWALAVTAGICEEVLYRGFLIGYAARFMHPWLAVLATSAVFGFGHWYQGVGNAIQTGVVGLVMAVVYYATGSIAAPIALHAIVDIAGGLSGWLVVRGG